MPQFVCGDCLLWRIQCMAVQNKGFERLNSENNDDDVVVVLYDSTLFYLVCELIHQLLPPFFAEPARWPNSSSNRWGQVGRNGWVQ